MVALQVGRDGSLRGRRLHRSSGDRRLDDAAMAAVAAAAPFPAAPTGLTEPTYAFLLPVRFE